MLKLLAFCEFAERVCLDVVDALTTGDDDGWGVSVGDSFCETDASEMRKGLERHLEMDGRLLVEEWRRGKNDSRREQVHLTTRKPSMNARYV
jgi:hypothetical protein